MTTNEQEQFDTRTPQPLKRPWYTGAYKRVLMSSHRDDWHPDVYRNFDARKWVDAIASCGPDVLFMQSKSHSGNAYYQIEGDHSHAGLQGRDALGEVLELCHERGIKVMVNHCLVFDNYLFNQHPDWRIRNAKGEDSKQFSSIQYGRPGIVCWNSPYREIAISQADALSRKYPLDGIFYDQLFPYILVCHCDNCRRLYRQECDCDLPDYNAPSSPSYRHYVRWRNRRLYEFTRDLIDVYKRHRPDGLATFNSPRPHTQQPSAVERVELADNLCGDPCGAGSLGLSVSIAANTWSNLTKNEVAELDLARMRGGELAHTGIYPISRLTLQSTLCLAQNCAVMYINPVNVDGTLYESSFRAYKEVFDAMRPMEPFLGGERIKWAAVYISDYSKDFLYEAYAEVDGSHANPFDWRVHNQEDSVPEEILHLGTVAEYTSGLEQAFNMFLRHQVPVDMITRLRADRLDQYSLIFVPDAFCMSDEEAETLRAYVKGGGNLIATRYTSLADEDGKRRTNFALSEVFGADYVDETENHDSYISVPSELCRSAGIPDDMEVKVDRQTVIKAKRGAEVLGHLVLPYTIRGRDAERWIGVWDSPPGPVTEHPAVVMNRFGKGRCLYFAARVHALDQQTSLEEPRELMYSLARAMMKEEAPLSVEGPPWLVVVGYRKPDEGCITVHVVNAQNDEFILPLDEIKVNLRLKDGEQAESVTGQPQGQTLPFEQDGNVVCFSMSVQIYRIAVVKLAKGETLPA